MSLYVRWLSQNYDSETYQSGFCGCIHFRKANFKGRGALWENHSHFNKISAGQAFTMSMKKTTLNLSQTFLLCLKIGKHLLAISFPFSLYL